MATFLITGGTGLVGKALTTALLNAGETVIILTRNAQKYTATTNLRYAEWDVLGQTIDNSIFASVDHIIHLAGAGVADQRWTTKRKKEILDSRVQSGALLVKTLQQNKHQVQSFISASAIGWYGADPVIPNPAPFTEDAVADTAFLGETCRQWEESVRPLQELGIRLVTLRIGIVLSEKGGALKEFLKPIQLGVAAILGNGKQIISWIHIDDLVKLFITAAQNDNYLGVYNAVATQPVSNKELTITLAKAKRKFYLPVFVPSFILKWVLGEMSIEVLKSATVSNQKIRTAGFQLQYPEIEKALKS